MIVVFFFSLLTTVFECTDAASALAQLNARYASACIHNDTFRSVSVGADIEDTLVSPPRSYRTIKAGYDKAWARNMDFGKVLYPGICSLLVQLAKGPRGGVFEAPFEERPINIYSARPEELPTSVKPVAEQHPEVNQSVAIAWGVGLGEALAGMVNDNLFKSDAERYEKYGEEKYNDALQYANRSSENSCYIFFGDDGHGDVGAAVLMLYDVPRMAHAFIHAVEFTDDDGDTEDDDTEQPLLRQSTGTVRDAIVWWRTAPGAALQAHCRGMITRTSLAIVVGHTRNTTERNSCLARCTPCSPPCPQDKCQAPGPGAGYARGCAPLLYELALVDDFLAGNRTCNDTVPLVDATPVWADALSRAKPPVYGDMDAMAAREAMQVVDILLLDNRTAASNLTLEEQMRLDEALRTTSAPVTFKTDDRTDNTFTSTQQSSASSIRPTFLTTWLKWI